MSLSESIIAKITDLPTLPVVANNLISVMQDKEHSAHDIVKIVSNDSSLTSKILRLANSAAFAPRQPISTLARAVMQLGEEMVLGAAIGSCTTQLYLQPLEGYEASKRALWDHSLLVAISAREVSRYAKDKISSDEAFTAGLLHDIGKSILSEFMKGDTQKMVNWLDDGLVRDFIQAEQGLLNTDHSEVGLAIAKHWKLPESLCEAIGYHHRPKKAKPEFKCLVYSVHIADNIAQFSGSGTGTDDMGYIIDSEYENYIEMSNKDVESLLLKVQEEFLKVKESILPNNEEGNDV